MLEPFSFFPQKQSMLLVAYFLVIQLTNSVLPVAKRFPSTIL
ncbi:putative membrane protein [Vibrio vulnificus]|nr:putative membrane protein [Vibrio vulnificus]OQK64406.1 putative membrane protein [Vibrio vulnificus]